MINNTDKDYYIVDFTASQKHFHQYPLIISISNFLIKKGYTPKILIPVVADRVDIKHASANVNLILDTGYTRYQKPLRHLIHKMLSITTSGRFSGSSIKKLLRRKYINSSLKYFRKINSYNKIHIIFPNPDPLSLELAIKLSNDTKMKNYFFYFRIVGGESRGILSSNCELDALLKLVKTYPKNIRVGVETTGYKTYLENLGFESSLIFWSPWPCLENFDKSKLENQRLTIGFLGCAKQRKGFDNIPSILTNLKNEGYDCNILVQEANFSWPEYESTRKQIIEIMGYRFKFLPSSLELRDLQKYINMCDLMILPYDTVSYSINGSGVLYHACDSSVPVLTTKGVGFASEIAEFNLGLIYTSLDEITDLVRKTQLTKFDFDNYNSKRNEATNEFYSIS
jgi:glycosyltransferase involved in cell wall biosynthesis